MKFEIRSFSPNFQGLYPKQKYEIYKRCLKFPLAKKFFNFCENVFIKSKDYPKPIRFSPNIWTYYQWLLAEKLLDPEVHRILALKPRQAGGTTLTAMFNLFCAFIIDHLQGAIIGADYAQVRTPISIMRQMYNLLPPSLKRKKVEDNIFRIRFDNGSYFEYYYPSSRETKIGRMGRGTAINYAHITEAAFLANEEDLAVFEASFSTTFPYRKYIYETTANGYNFFYERWISAKELDDPETATVFAGWWSRDNCIITSKEALKAFSKPVFPWEEEKVKEVESLYGIKITLEQLAWWRREAIYRGKDERIMLSEFPFTEEDAFSATTKTFVDFRQIKDTFLSYEPPRKSYIIVMNKNWEDLALEENAFGTLKIWEHWEERDPYAKYVLGVDPAYSTMKASDNCCIQILKCYGDKVYQVGEFAYNRIDLQRFALLACYLAACYGALINAEIQGGGQGFIALLQNVKRFAVNNIYKGPIWETIRKRTFLEYLYKRRDTLGAGGAMHFYMTAELKRTGFIYLKTLIENKELVIKSKALIEEIQNIVEYEGDFITRTRSVKDDRVMALILALFAYRDYIQGIAMTEEEANLKRKEKEEKKEEEDIIKIQQQIFNQNLFLEQFKKWGLKIQ